MQCDVDHCKYWRSFCRVHLLRFKRLFPRNFHGFSLNDWPARRGRSALQVLGAHSTTASTRGGRLAGSQARRTSTWRGRGLIGGRQLADRPKYRARPLYASAMNTQTHADKRPAQLIVHRPVLDLASHLESTSAQAYEFDWTKCRAIPSAHRQPLLTRLRHDQPMDDRKQQLTWLLFLRV